MADTQSSEEVNVSKWKLLSDYFLEQLSKPLKHPEFIFYFIFIICGFGMIGVWTTIVIEKRATHFSNENIVFSIMGYALPLIATGAVDFIFSKEKNIHKAIKVLGFSTIGIGIALLLLCFSFSYVVGYCLSILGVIISWLMWWIANAENSNIIDDDLVDKMSKETKKLGETLEDLEKNG